MYASLLGGAESKAGAGVETGAAITEAVTGSFLTTGTPLALLR